MHIKLTLSEKIEILYLAYFIYHQKPYRPAFPPKTIAIALAVMIFALMALIAPLLTLTWYFIIAVFMLIFWCAVVLLIILPNSNPAILLLAQRLQTRYREWKTTQIMRGLGAEIKQWIQQLIKESQKENFRF